MKSQAQQKKKLSAISIILAIPAIIAILFLTLLIVVSVINTSDEKKKQKNALLLQYLSNQTENAEDEEFVEDNTDTTMEDHIFPLGNVSINSNYVWGIDISRYQKGLSDEYFDMLKQAECKFIYIQFGITSQNSMELLDFSEEAFTFARQAEEHEIHFGFYFLTESRTDQITQKEFDFIIQFLQNVKEKNFKYNIFPLMIDHEVATESYEIKQNKIKQLAKLVANLKSEGIETIIYTSSSRYDLLNETLGKNQLFWLANYNYYTPGIAPEKNNKNLPNFFTNNPNVLMWQYSNNSHLLAERCSDFDVDSSIENRAIDRNIMKSEMFQYYTHNLS